MKRTKYTTEFKLDAVKQILEKGHSATDVASRLGVPVGLLYICSIPRQADTPKVLFSACAR
jgi:transposase